MREICTEIYIKWFWHLRVFYWINHSFTKTFNIFLFAQSECAQMSMSKTEWVSERGSCYWIGLWMGHTNSKNSQIKIIAVYNVLVLFSRSNTRRAFCRRSAIPEPDWLALTSTRCWLVGLLNGWLNGWLTDWLLLAAWLFNHCVKIKRKNSFFFQFW